MAGDLAQEAREKPQGAGPHAAPDAWVSSSPELSAKRNILMPAQEAEDPRSR